ncbi:MAG: DUF4864 domain-containing protein [Sulfitobacter sp.]
MRGIILAVMFCVSWAGLARAQDLGAQATITQQFEAFKADDFAGAFAFASPGLQRFFQTPENFERMITGGYPMVHRPGAVRFLEKREAEGALWQRLSIRDAKGAVHVLEYKMLPTDEGWRIDGVQFVPAAGLSA